MLRSLTKVEIRQAMQDKTGLKRMAILAHCRPILSGDLYQMNVQQYQRNLYITKKHM